MSRPLLERLRAEEAAASDDGLLRRLLVLSWVYRGRVVWVFILQCLVLLATLMAVSLTGVAIDVVRLALEPGAPRVTWPLGFIPPAPWSPIDALLATSGAVLALALMRALFTSWYEVAAGTLVHVHIVPTLRAELFARLTRLRVAFFDEHDTASIVNRLTSDVQMLRSFVDGVLLQGAVVGMSLSVFLVYMLGTHVTLTLVGIASTPVLLIATRVFSSWARAAYRENRRLSDRMVRAMTEGIEGILVTKLFGNERAQFERFAEKNRAVRDQQRQIFVNVSRYTPAIDGLTKFNVAVVLAYGAGLVMRAELRLGELVVFVGLLQQFATRASNMAVVVNTLQQSLAGARRVFQVLDAEPALQLRADAVALGAVAGELELRDVSFDHEGRARALCNLDLHVPRGAHVGIMGATGSGKSTLLALLARFHEPSSGRILLDGVALERVEPGELRRQLGFVFQETFLFRDTIANNIAFGLPGSSRERIERAARLAGAEGFIEALPDGYDTLLDERALNLSGGQRQRLALARALLLEPRMLLLDEPTSALDASTEARVLDALLPELAGRTTLMVSSRVSALRRMDFIVVLERGRVVERGTHAELMARAGRYRAAALLQQGGEQVNEGQPSEGQLDLAQLDEEARS